MRLVQKTIENRDALEFFVNRDAKQLPHSIAEAYLANRTYQESSEIQLAQKRLQQFEALLSQIAHLENFLSDPDLKRLYLPLELQWYLAIGSIADLTVEQSVIDRFTARLQALAQAQPSLAESYYWVKSLDLSQLEAFEQFKRFFEAWRSLWFYFFDFQDPIADKAVITILHQFPQPSAQKQSV